MPRSTASRSAEELKLADRVPLRALSVAFLKVSLYGIGGGAGLVWAHRIAVDQRRWVNDAEFADIVSLCQFMPGPNIVGIAVCIGTRLRGTIGAIAATSGFLIIPWAIGFAIGMLYLEHVHHPVLRNILGGVAATASGLMIATGIRLLMPHRRRPAALLFAALAFGLMAFGKLPLLVVLFGLVPLGIGVAGIENARAR